MTAGRNLDWELFLASHGYRYGVLIRDVAIGVTAPDQAKENGERYSQVRSLKAKMMSELREYLGADAIVDAVKKPVG